MNIESSKIFEEEHYTAAIWIENTTKMSKLQDTKYKADCTDND